MTATAPHPPPAPQPRATGLPDGWTVFLAAYRLLLRSVATRGRILAVGGLAGLSVVIGVVVRTSTDASYLVAATDYVSGNLSTLFPAGILVFGSATLGDLVDDGSLVYLWLRPVPPRTYVLAAWAATMTVALPVIGLPIFVAGVIIEPTATLAGGAALAMGVALATYSAMFVTAGIRFRRALPWGVAYILIWEGFVARAGETASKLAVRSYVRSLLSNVTGVGLHLGEFTTASSLVVTAVMTVLALRYAGRRLANSDVP
jgi:ABC-2 type transport system permease protein